MNTTTLDAPVDRGAAAAPPAPHPLAAFTEAPSGVNMGWPYSCRRRPGRNRQRAQRRPPEPKEPKWH